MPYTFDEPASVARILDDVLATFPGLLEGKQPMKMPKRKHGSTPSATVIALGSIGESSFHITYFSSTSLAVFMTNFSVQPVCLGMTTG